MCVKLQIEQTQRSKNLRIQSEITERGAVIEGKGQNPSTKRKTGECFQWKAIGSCSKGESRSFRHKPASGNWEVKVESARGSGLKPANERVKESNEQTMKSSTSLEDRPATRAKIPCAWRAKWKISSCDFRHPPVCRNYKSESRCIYGSNCLFRHADGEEKPRKRSKKESTQGAVAILKHREFRGCVSQNSDPKKSILRKAGQVRGNASGRHTIKFSGRTRYEIRTWDRKGPSRGIIQKSDTHERNPWAPKFEERTPKVSLRQEDCARKAAWDVARKYTSSKPMIKPLFFFCRHSGANASLQKPQKIVCLWLIRELQCTCLARGI